MRTILNMKPGPGGRRLQKELEAKILRFRLLAGFYL